MALDGLGEKFLSLFKPKEDSRFKGQGRKLGSSAEVPTRGNQSGQRHVSNGAPRGSAGTQPPTSEVGGPSGSPNCGTPPLQPPPQPLGTGGRPALVVSRSHRTEEVVLDAAVMVTNTPTGREAHLVAASKLRVASPTSPPTSASNASPSFPSSPYAQPAASDPTATQSGAPANGSGSLALEVPRYSPGGGTQTLGGASGSQRGSRGSGPNRRPHTSHPSSMVSTISTPTAAEKRIGGGFQCTAPPTDGAMADYGVAPASSEAYELHRCLAHVMSHIPPSRPRSPLIENPARDRAPPPPSTAVSSDLNSGSGGGGCSDSPSAGPSTEASSPSAARQLPQPGPAPASSATSSRGVGLSEGAAAFGAGVGAGAMSSGSGGISGSLPRGPAPPSAVASGAFPGLLPTVAAPTAVLAPAPVPAGPRECCDALLRVLRNVLTKPGDPKFRQIRLSNPRVQETIVGVPGAVEFLEAAGFRMEFAPDDGSETANEAYLVLPDSVAPTALAEAFRILSAAMAAHGFTSGGSAGVAADAAPGASAAPVATTTAASTAAQQSAGGVPPPRASPASRAGAEAAAAAAAAAATNVPAADRCTQVVLAAAPDVEVPDWFFERTGAEVRALWQAMVLKRQEAEQFMTRTMREVRRAQQAAAVAQDEAGGEVLRQSADVATVRVRFPEGVCLQGNFGASEPVTRVFEWVAASLRSPTLTFELIQPDRRPLATTAAQQQQQQLPRSRAPATSAARPLTVRGADLLPSVLLNLRPTGQEAAALTAQNVPLLSDALLRTTRPQ